MLNDKQVSSIISVLNEDSLGKLQNCIGYNNINVSLRNKFDDTIRLKISYDVKDPYNGRTHREYDDSFCVDIDGNWKRRYTYSKGNSIDVEYVIYRPNYFAKEIKCILENL